MFSEFSIVRQDRFIQATRDSGYKGTESALSELIDNSIQAGARKVSINMTAVEREYSGKGPRPIPRVVEVAIADDGKGMSPDLLRRSLRFGDTSRFDDRSGLGRFGMGLPNASASQCRRTEVYSWQRGQKPQWTYVDVDEVASGELAEVPEAIETPIPTHLVEQIDKRQGTLVVWRNCDRLDHDGKIDTLERSLRHSLGRIFRYFLIADFEITLNGKRVGPFDPLYLMPQARLPGDLLAAQHGDTLSFQVPIPGKPNQLSTVEVVLSLLPSDWQLRFKKTKEGKIELKKRHLDERRVFSIVRGRREVDLQRDPYRAAHWTSDRWYRVEVRFEPELDEVFGVTHTKQHASLKSGTPIYEKLRETISANVATMIDMIKARGKKAHKATTDRAEESAQRVIPRLRPVEGLAEKTEPEVSAEIKDFIERVSWDKPVEEKERLERRLSSFEVLIEYEALPGAPIFRVQVVGRSIVVLLNTSHRFYELVYRRIENESPIGKTGIDLLLMALGRSEALGGDELRTWYDDQRQEWSQHIKAFVEQMDEPDEPDPSDMNEELLATPNGLV